VTGANVITADFSDWATNCPEYKVTAIEVRLTDQHSAWQEEAVEFRRLSRRILGRVGAAE
jgi:formate dehydrogenase major subunit